jgi:uncharacterized protein (DUF58 family)
VRGEHSFGAGRFRSGDLFGRVTPELLIDSIDTLVVCPRVVPLSRLGLPARQPLGGLVAPSWLFDDPSRLAGVRDYRPEDGLRRIHWAASARTQRLQTKVYQPTTSRKLMILLNVTSTGGPEWRPAYDAEALEMTIMTAASLAAWGQAHGYQVGLATNGMHRLARPPVRFDPSSATDHSVRLQEALGRLIPLSSQRFERLLPDESRRLTAGTAVVVLTPGLTAPTVAALIGIRRRGHPLALVLTGWQSPELPLDGIVVRRVGRPDTWRELSALAIAG